MGEIHCDIVYLTQYLQAIIILTCNLNRLLIRHFILFPPLILSLSNVMYFTVGIQYSIATRGRVSDPRTRE